MVIKKTKLSTITAALATMVVIATLGTVGAVGQQQIAFAEELDLERLLELSEELEDLDEKIIEKLTSSTGICIGTRLTGFCFPQN